MADSIGLALCNRAQCGAHSLDWPPLFGAAAGLMRQALPRKSPVESGGICSGWGSVIKDAQLSQRFDQLLETWSREGGEVLKATAANVLRTRKGGR